MQDNAVRFTCLHLPVIVLDYTARNYFHEYSWAHLNSQSGAPSLRNLIYCVHRLLTLKMGNSKFVWYVYWVEYWRGFRKLWFMEVVRS